MKRWLPARITELWSQSPAFRRLALALLTVALGVIVLLVVVAAGDDPSPPSQASRVTDGPDTIRGTAGSDNLVGLAGADRLYGYDGDDRIDGGPGPDTIVGGQGQDVLNGGPGDDRINAQDGERDVINCGGGRDTIVQDPIDERGPDCPRVAEATSDEQTVILDDVSWSCTEEVDLDLVKVTMRTQVDDAVRIDQNCSGRIGRIEVETWTADGIKVQNRGTVAHDLVIESGYVKCHDVFGEYHQDGIQVMGGTRLTFRNLAVDCLGNANLFLSEGGGLSSTPTDVVCEGCILGPNSGQTLFYAGSLRSGVRDTVVCTGRFRAIRIEPGAEEIVEENTRVLPHDDPACADVTGPQRSE
jgi:RTX calcium-binding nonapeptide repeat (4 copies)